MLDPQDPGARPVSFAASLFPATLTRMSFAPSPELLREGRLSLFTRFQAASNFYGRLAQPVNYRIVHQYGPTPGGDLAINLQVTSSVGVSEVHAGVIVATIAGGHVHLVSQNRAGSDGNLIPEFTRPVPFTEPLATPYLQALQTRHGGNPIIVQPNTLPNMRAEQLVIVILPNLMKTGEPVDSVVRRTIAHTVMPPDADELEAVSTLAKHLVGSQTVAPGMHELRFSDGSLIEVLNLPGAGPAGAHASAVTSARRDTEENEPIRVTNESWFMFNEHRAYCNSIIAGIAFSDDLRRAEVRFVDGGVDKLVPQIAGYLLPNGTFRWGWTYDQGQPNPSLEFIRGVHDMGVRERIVSLTRGELPAVVLEQYQLMPYIAHMQRGTHLYYLNLPGGETAVIVLHSPRFTLPPISAHGVRAALAAPPLPPRVDAHRALRAYAHHRQLSLSKSGKRPSLTLPSGEVMQLSVTGDQVAVL